MKPVSVAYWNAEMKQMQTTTLQQPDPINTLEFSVSFQWVPNYLSGMIPLLEDYRLHTTVIYDVNALDKKTKDNISLRFNVSDELKKKVEDACFRNDVIIDVNYLKFLPCL